MIAANECMARTLRGAGIGTIRRVVKDPERWGRIMELAQVYGERLPPAPDPAALNAFLLRRRAADPVHYPDISLAVLKLLGSGEYVVARPGDDQAPARPQDLDRPVTKTDPDREPIPIV